MQLTWPQLEDGTAEAFAECDVELEGWWITPDAQAASAYGLLLDEAPCCGGCASGDPLRSVEVLLKAPLPPGATTLRLRGRLQVLIDDPAGWRYRLVDAHSVDVPRAPALGRRLFLASGAAMGLVACSAGRFANYAAEPADDADTLRWMAAVPTIDIHSHAGRVIVSRDPAIGANRPFLPVAAPMREGGMNIVCLAIVTDTLVTRVSADRLRFEAWREPAPGELYALSQTEFKRLGELIARERLEVITTAQQLDAAPARGPAIVVASEGADFLEGRIERVDEAHAQHRLRHLQLTHYRVNELGDIQTAPPVHGGLTDFGADVVRRCNRLGIVVDVAHGTLDLVKRAADVATKPLVISHTSLAARPGPRSRQITAEHARVIAQTGGVIGVWPSAGAFHDLDAMALGAKRMADAVGVAHVGLGTDMLGFISPPVLGRYQQLPRYANALLAAGFTREEAGMVLGGNYRRVFAQALG